MFDSEEHHDTHEYDDERDMDRFWEAAQLDREPVKQLWYVPGLILLIILSIPWYRSAGETGRVILGLPTWIWVPLACALGVSILTAFAALRFWRQDDTDSD